MSKNNKNATSNIDNDPNFHKGFGEFTFPNGDSYVGDYCAHRSGLLWREGHGIYTTQDGQVYEGEWYDDKLVENKEIIVVYPNGAQYQGPISKNKYQGAGTYMLDSNMNISCQFSGNKPVGTVTLIDCQGKLWRGIADENSVILLPENVFYLNLNDFQGKGLPREPIDTTAMHPTPSESSKESEHDLPDKLWEQIIFAKSQLTKNDVDFTDSDWWKNYVRYKEKYNEIQSKIDENVSLSDDELKWVQQFKSFKNKRESRKYEKQLARMKEEERVFALNEIYQSSDFQNSCRPVKVFYPQHRRHHITEETSFDGIIEGTEEVAPLRSTDVIYVNSIGKVAIPPPSLPIFDKNFIAPIESTSSSSNSEIKDDDLTVQFHEFVRYSHREIQKLTDKINDDARASLTPDVFSRSLPEYNENIQDDQELHFSKFREEMLLDVKKVLHMEKKYQEKKQQKSLEKSRSKEDLGSRMRMRSSEVVGKYSGSKLKEQSTRISEQASVTMKTSADARHEQVELLVKNCVEDVSSDGKIQVQQSREEPEAVHTHDVGSTTESLTGIPRELLLKSKFQRRKI